MKTVIFADIHSNLEALNAFQKAIEKISPDRVVCLGDIVGYAVNPNECVDIVKQNNWISVSGNHDKSASKDIDLSFFNPFAKEALLWTRKELTQESKEYLLNLPLTYEDSFFTCVHASLFEPDQFHYLDNYSDVTRDCLILTDKEANICFVAHTHIPSIFVYRNENLYRDYSKQADIKSQSNYMINVGSIGQPRDRNPDICFCVWDSNSGNISFIRKSYDIEKAQEKIRKKGLPSLLAERLGYGW